MVGSRGKRSSRAWTEADSALWHTAQILDDIVSRRVPQHRVDTLFALQDREMAFVASTFRIEAMRAVGDGSYVHNTTFAFGTGGLGLALAAGTLAGSAVGNARRRAQAMADARVIWRPDFDGTVTVTSQGFYLLARAGLFRWGWEAIDLMEIQGFNVLVLQGRSAHGPVTWRVTTMWAELMFVLWALARHPQHPQLASGNWLPPGWAQWAEAQGFRPALPELGG